MTVEELRLKWPVREVSVYGNCIVIPDSRFKREWEADLRAEGASVLYQALPGGTCALVRLKSRQLEPTEPTVVYQLKKKGGGTFQRWTCEENVRFMKRMQELKGTISHRCNVLAREFNRSGLLQRYYRLRVKPEFRDKEPKLPTVLPTDVKLPTSLPTVLPLMGLREVLVEIRSEVYAMVREHGDFRSLHEGYAVILEELEELWCEVKMPAEKRDLSRLRSEALDVAASAAKFALFIERKGLEAKP